MKCRISAYTCPYHACMRDDCQKKVVVSQGVSFGVGRCSRDRTLESYREYFGYTNPPAGTHVVIKHAAGLKFYIWWPTCPDGEDIIEGWFSSKKAAIAYTESHGWTWS